jgi:hypothetical protein
MIVEAVELLPAIKQNFPSGTPEEFYKPWTELEAYLLHFHVAQNDEICLCPVFGSRLYFTDGL